MNKPNDGTDAPNGAAAGAPEQLTPAYMRAWERRLGPEKVQQACRLMRAHGWSGDGQAPIWVWAETFRQVEEVAQRAAADKP